MSVSWATRPAACGHRRCTAAGWLLFPAGLCLFASLPFLVTASSWKPFAVFSGSALACAVAIAMSCRACWIGGDPAAERLEVILADPATWAEFERQMTEELNETEEESGK